MATAPIKCSKPTLLGLPAEIRNEIFKLALVSSTPLFASIRQRKRLPYPLPPNLARVSRQARHEAIPIYFGANTFRFEQPHQAGNWYELLSAHRGGPPQHIRKIIISNCYCCSHLRQRYPSEMDMLLSLDRTRLISIDYLGRVTRGSCTCKLEEQARKIIHQAEVPLNRALVWFAANLSKRKDGLECQYHLRREKERVASCGCGSWEQRMNGTQAPRFT